jgi:predicted nucleic acid-binding protein
MPMTADRIFLDANVLFSVAYGSRGLISSWDLAEEKRCLLFTSEYAVAEAKRNLFTVDQLKRLETYVSKVRIAPEVDPGMPCPIPLPEKDRPVMLAALAAKVNYLVTGDTVHFGRYFGQVVSGIKICRPADYLKRGK